MFQLANRFDSGEEHILPTAFGNIIRAFEAYPRVMYGLDEVFAWSRLLAVIPKDYHDKIDEVKTDVAFWMNVGGLSFGLILEYVGIAIYSRSLPAAWIAIPLLVLAGVSPYFACDAAQRWGEYVKAAFDVFTPQLRATLGLSTPKDRLEEKQQWARFSQAIIYRLAESIPGLQKTDEKTRTTRRNLNKQRAR
jgi:hypothetical protein